MQEDGPLLHAGQCRDGVVWHLVVGQFAVDLVTQNHEVVFHHKSGDLLELFLRHHRPRGIGRKVEHEHACFGRNRLLEIGGPEGELILGACGHGHRDTAGQQDAGAVGDVARFVVEDLVARIEKGAEGQVDCLGDTDGDDDLVVRIVADREVTLHVGGDGATEARGTEVGGVAGATLFQRVNRRLPDMPRGDKVGFADAEGDDLLHRLNDLEEVADSRTGDGADMVRDA